MLAFALGYRQVTSYATSVNSPHLTVRTFVSLFSHTEFLAVFKTKRTRAKSSNQNLWYEQNALVNVLFLVSF